MDISTKELNLFFIEEFYCERMSELVEDSRYEDSDAIYKEFTIDSEDPDEWMFIEDLTNVC